jgi:hypothetical protein
MSTQEQGRELITQQRLHDEQMHESMLSRSEAEADNLSEADAFMQEQARELMTRQRHHDEHLQQSILSRVEAEVGVHHVTADSSQE